MTPASARERVRRLAALGVLLIAGLASLATSMSVPYVTRSTSGVTVLPPGQSVSLPFHMEMTRRDPGNPSHPYVTAHVVGRSTGSAISVRVLAADPSATSDVNQLGLAECTAATCSWDLELEIRAQASLTLPVTVPWRVTASSDYGTGSAGPDVQLLGLPEGLSVSLLGSWLVVFVLSAIVFGALGALATWRRIPSTRLLVVSMGVLLLGAIYFAFVARDGTSSMPWLTPLALLVGFGLMWKAGYQAHSPFGNGRAALIALFAITPAGLFGVAGAGVYRLGDVLVIAVATGSLVLPLLGLFSGRKRLLSRLRGTRNGLLGPSIAVALAVAIEVWAILLAFDGPAGLAQGATWLAAPLAALLLRGAWQSLRGEPESLRILGGVLALMACLVVFALNLAYEGPFGEVAPPAPTESFLGAIVIGFASFALIFTGWTPPVPRPPGTEKRPLDWPSPPTQQVILGRGLTRPSTGNVRSRGRSRHG